jgi:hypothetical protein
VQDVIHMPALRELYRAKLCDAWWRKIETETAARIRLSQTRNFNGQGRHMAEAPPSWQHWRPSAAQMRSRTLLTCRRDSLISSTTKPASATWIYGRGIEEHEVDLSEIFEALNIGRSLGRTGGGPHRRWSDSDDGDDDDFREFTACDSECGYCGGCDY